MDGDGDKDRHEYGGKNKDEREMKMQVEMEIKVKTMALLSWIPDPCEVPDRAAGDTLSLLSSAGSAFAGTRPPLGTAGLCAPLHSSQ